MKNHIFWGKKSDVSTIVQLALQPAKAHFTNITQLETPKNSLNVGGAVSRRCVFTRNFDVSDGKFGGNGGGNQGGVCVEFICTLCLKIRELKSKMNLDLKD